MKRNKFSLSHYNLASMKMGPLYPAGLTEVLPGDTVQMSTSALVRLSPLMRPVMHPVHVLLHHWFVPTRLVWDNWETFITGGTNAQVSNPPAYPVMRFNTIGINAMANYMGLPNGAYNAEHDGPLEVSAIPFRMYNLIVNEFYRDQDLVPELVINKGDGLDTDTDRGLVNVAWEKDYFTTARPWAQKGPDVMLPFGDRAPVVPREPKPGYPLFESSNDPGVAFQVSIDDETLKSGVGAADGEMQWFDPALEADLSGATAVDVNTVRRVFALQRYQEARARYGSRYTEYLRYLGVTPSDARLQRPEYVGGGKQTIQFSEVLQTAPVYDSEEEELVGDVGDLKGHGISAVRTRRARKFIPEHGYIFTLMSVRPKTIYMQGVPRHWLRRTKEDYWQKELQHIGQQEIYNQEIFAPQTLEDRWLPFGWQDRYDEYRRTESRVSGDFRTINNDWHLARIFSDPPVLNNDFVTSNPTDRVFADQSGDDTLWCMINHSIQARRMVAAKGTSYIL